MSEQVGSIFYEVTLDTAQMVQGQRKVQAELDKTSSSLSDMTPRLTAVAAAVSLFAVALAAAAIKSARAADDMRMLGARIEVAAGSMESGATAMAALEAISKRTGTTVAANADVFTRLNQSIIQMGGNQADTLRITELLGKAIRVSGASAVEAKSAMLQFGQALGSGKLQGDELRSLMENAPYLMKQLADGIGVPVGALKKLGEEGKLTADVVTNALSKASTQIDADFQKFPQTIASAMDVAIDAAGRANSKLDELTGISTALTGITKGLGEVLDKLAQQFGAANDEAGTLGRNSAIASWADSSKVALSYVIDAADMAWQVIGTLGRNVGFVFASVVAEIGGIGAQIAAVMRGDFAGAKAIGDAMTIDADSRRAALDAADKKALGRAKTAGQEMRDAWAVGAGGGRGSVNPEAAASTLKPCAGAAGGDKKAVFDQLGYLATLKRGTVEAWDAINAKEDEALRKSQALMDAGKISKKNHEEAVSLITRAAVMDRQDLMAQETDSYLKEMTRDYKARVDAQKAKEELEARQKNARQASTLSTLGMNAEGGGIGAQEALIQAQAQSAMDAAEQARLLDLNNSQVYADQKTAIEAKMHRDIDALRTNANTAAMNSTADIFDSLVSITKGAAGEQSDVYKAMFDAQKAFSIAQSIIAIQTGIAQASALPFPANLGAMATVAAATAGIVATINSTSVSGRQYGGAVSGGSLYRVNEKGSPEMFTAGNGSQYMLPTTGGSVTAADKIGVGGQSAAAGGASVKVVFNVVQDTSKAGSAQQRQGSDGTNMIDVFVAQVESKMAEGISRGAGPLNSAMQQTFGLNRSAGSY